MVIACCPKPAGLGRIYSLFVTLILAIDANAIDPAHGFGMGNKKNGCIIRPGIPDEQRGG
jgi:hypothetical protein